jgi:hypothetical protein
MDSAPADAGLVLLQAELAGPSAALLAELGRAHPPSAPLDSCFYLRPHYVSRSQAEIDQGLDLGL